MIDFTAAAPIVAELGPTSEQAARIVTAWRATEQRDHLLKFYIAQTIDDNVHAALKGAGECVWTHNDIDDYWKPACADEAFQLTEGNPADNRMRFCHYCGRRLVSRADTDARSTLAQKVLETVEAQRRSMDQFPAKQRREWSGSHYDAVQEGIERHNQIITDVLTALRELFQREGIEVK